MFTSLLSASKVEAMAEIHFHSSSAMLNALGEAVGPGRIVIFVA